MFRRSKSIILVITMLLLSLVFTACAQKPVEQQEDNFPDKPIRLIIPVSAGGGMETSARQWQKYFEAEIGENILIDNRPGAGTLIGNRLVAEAEPDGYTLGLFSSPDIDFTLISMDAPYTLDDFDVLGLYLSDPGVIRVHKDSPWNTLEEFIDYVKTQPEGSVTVSVPTFTSGNALAFKMIEEYAGVKFNIVGFDGGNPARLALAGKKVDATHAGVYNSRMIEEETKVIAVHYHENIWPELEGVPTVAETFGKDVPDTGSFYGLYAPAGFKEKYPERFKKIEEAFQKAINDPEFLASLEEIKEKEKITPMNADEASKFLEDSVKVLEQYKHFFVN